MHLAELSTIERISQRRSPTLNLSHLILSSTKVLFLDPKAFEVQLDEIPLFSEKRTIFFA